MFASEPRKNRSWATLALWGLGLPLLAVSLPVAAQDSKDSSKSKNDDVNIGLVASKHAGAKEVGLPIYPMAKPHKDNSQDEAAVQLGLWGGKSGFKLVVVKLDSEDSPDKIAAFYRKALARYGNVLDCSAAPAKANSSDKKASRHLDCEDDHPKPGELELKAGTKDDQHIVAIEPNGNGTIFQLVYLQARGSEE